MGSLRASPARGLAASSTDATPTESGAFPHGDAGATDAAAEGSLDLLEGISDPRAGGGCPRWPEGYWLLAEQTGEVLLGRCRATNLCRWCQVAYVRETVEMLTLDAMEHAPTLWSVLTAREHLTRRDTYRHLEQLRRAIRGRWAGAEWFIQVEFQRRGALHLNLLHKGVPIDQADELHELLAARWCARVDAELVGQWSGAIADGVGVVRYISKTLAHGLKAEQAPPIGWRGHRTSQSRGYLARPASEMRREARESLRRRSLLRKARGLDGDVEQNFEQLLAESDATTWRLVIRSPAARLDADPAGASRLLSERAG